MAQNSIELLPYCGLYHISDVYTVSIFVHSGVNKKRSHYSSPWFNNYLSLSICVLIYFWFLLFGFSGIVIRKSSDSSNGARNTLLKCSLLAIPINS